MEPPPVALERDRATKDAVVIAATLAALAGPAKSRQSLLVRPEVVTIALRAHRTRQMVDQLVAGSRWPTAVRLIVAASQGFGLEDVKNLIGHTAPSC